MKFIKNNKLLISLFIAVFLVALVVSLLASAKYVPGMSKYTDRAYYDLPKGNLPAPTMTPEEELKRRSKVGFIDPIYRERFQEAREGVPLPSDILPGPGIIPGVTDKEFGNVSAPVIPGYGPAPRDSYDELYKKDSPYKMWGRPGRIGRDMEKIMTAEKKDDQQLTDATEKQLEKEPSLPPDASAKIDAADQSKFTFALGKILRVIKAARDASEDKTDKPVEGKLEKESDKDKKEKSK